MATQLRISPIFTPAERETLRLALADGLITNKEQARALGLTDHAIKHRWRAIYSRLGLAWGQCSRARALIEASRRDLIHFGILLLLSTHTGMANLDAIRTHRPTRPPQVRTLRQGKTGGLQTLIDQLIEECTL